MLEDVPESLQVVARTNAERGALFAALVEDFFASLGYETTLANVHRTGREIDLEGRHRIEVQRLLVAECKGHQAPIGGDLVNKFAGALGAERNRIAGQGPEASDVVGYFVSLSGFTSSAIAQESAISPARLHLVDQTRLIGQLRLGHFLPSRETITQATAQVGGVKVANLKALSRVVLCTPLGVFVAQLLGEGIVPTDCVLLHADGRPLTAQGLEDLRKKMARPLRALLGLSLHVEAGSRYSTGVLEGVRRKYATFLVSSCGEIQLDGLPADEDAGLKRLPLEKLFVPLHLDVSKGRATRPVSESRNHRVETPGSAGASRRRSTRAAQEEWRPRVPVAETFSESNHIAILAPPGGGKSTLLKRLATAYAARERRAQVDDGLPNEPWLPILLRCRDLGESAREPLGSLISLVRRRAEIPDHLDEQFREVLYTAFDAGEALLLIDGLDEIADDGSRLAFAHTIRAFVATYPQVRLVVTSREAGFRTVAGTLASQCLLCRMSELNEADIRSLVSKWAQQVYGQNTTSARAAQELASQIVGIDRIRRLATNPMLLTILLLVRRWVGSLPTKRVALYQKAIETLLMTWNVEAYQPIDLDEALPRLQYVAYSMTAAGAKSIALPHLRGVLARAKQELPEALGYSLITDQQFIDGIERRSSLLVQAGHTLVDNKITPSYEFRHLTFQEYLCAQAIAARQYPKHSTGTDVLKVLTSHFGDESWREVVPLTLLLLGRDAGSAVEALQQAVVALRDQRPGSTGVEWTMLASAMQEDLQIAPALADSALEAMILFGGFSNHRGVQAASVVRVIQGRFGARVPEVTRRVFAQMTDESWRSGTVVIYYEAIARSRLDLEQMYTTFTPDDCLELLDSSDAWNRIKGALVTMGTAYEMQTNVRPKSAHWKRDSEGVMRVGERLAALLDGDLQAKAAGAWAIAWLATWGWSPAEPGIVNQALSAIWSDPSATNENVRFAIWAACCLPLKEPLSGGKRLAAGVAETRVKAGLADQRPLSNRWSVKDGAAILSYYEGGPLPTDQLVRIASDAVERGAHGRGSESEGWATVMLSALGELGQKELENLKPKTVKAASGRTRRRT